MWAPLSQHYVEIPSGWDSHSQGKRLGCEQSSGTFLLSFGHAELCKHRPLELSQRIRDWEVLQHSIQTSAIGGIVPDGLSISCSA